MLIFLFGQDTFRSSLKLREILLQYQKLHEESIHVRFIDCEEAQFSSFQTEAQSNSLFKIKKLLVVKNPFHSKEFVEKLKEQKKLLVETTDIVVFFEKGGVAAKDPFFKFLKEKAKTQEFAPLTPVSLGAWIVKAFAAFDTKADPGVADLLMRSCGNDLWKVSQEIQKLSAFSKSGNSLLKQKDAALFLQEPLEADVFQTLSLAGQGSKAKALERLALHFAKGESPFYLLSMFSWYARARARDPKAAHEKVFQADLAMKTGREDPGLALFSLAAGL